MTIREANQAYENWLSEELKGDVVGDDIEHKHERMSESPFAFLRATYWRWAETILEVCPDLASAPPALAVGDIHLENFGTWRDVEGRIVWGVNDFDEAAEMPYILDLVRLATSVLLAESQLCPTVGAVCRSILEGYERGLDAPSPFVLEREHIWLRKKFVVSEEFRTNFWRKVAKKHDIAVASSHPQTIPEPFAKALQAALPDRTIQLSHWPRTAGTGSLGRQRWVGYAIWRGAPLLREAKALVPSAWMRAHGRARKLRLNEIAEGRYRSPDPWYRAQDDVLVRRLSPNNRKLEIGTRLDAAVLLNPEMLTAMGQELAAVHLGTGDRKDAIKTDLDMRKKRAIRENVEAAAEFVRREQREWKKTAAKPKLKRAG